MRKRQRCAKCPAPQQDVTASGLCSEHEKARVASFEGLWKPSKSNTWVPDGNSGEMALEAKDIRREIVSPGA